MFLLMSRLNCNLTGEFGLGFTDHDCLLKQSMDTTQDMCNFCNMSWLISNTLSSRVILFNLDLRHYRTQGRLMIRYLSITEGVSTLQLYNFSISLNPPTLARTVSLIANYNAFNAGLPPPRDQSRDPKWVGACVSSPRPSSTHPSNNKTINGCNDYKLT